MAYLLELHVVTPHFGKLRQPRLRAASGEGERLWGDRLCCMDANRVVLGLRRTAFEKLFKNIICSICII